MKNYFLDYKFLPEGIVKIAVNFIPQFSISISIFCLLSCMGMCARIMRVPR